MKPKGSVSKTSGARQRQILDVALRCFLERGYDGTTLEQIVDESGISHGSIYHHFGSKGAIALRLYAEGMDDYHQRLLDVMQQHADVRKGIAAIVRNHLEWVGANRGIALFLTQLAMVTTPGEMSAKIADLNQQFFQSLYDWLKPFIGRGEIVRVPKQLYPSLIFGGPTHFARHWLAERMPIEPGAAAEVLAAAVWRSLEKRN